MNCFIIILVIVQIWHPYITMVESIDKDTGVIKPAAKTPTKLTDQLMDRTLTNPWTKRLLESNYINYVVTTNVIDNRTKTVVAFGLKDDFDIHDPWRDLLVIGQELASASTNPTAATDTVLFNEIISDWDNYGWSYVEKYGEPLIGPIPDRIKNLPIRADTQDYINTLAKIGQKQKMVPILAAMFASDLLFDQIYHHVKSKWKTQPTPLLALSTYSADNPTSDIISKISAAINAHSKGMTASDKQQVVTAFDAIWSAECRQQYGQYYVEEYGAIVAEKGTYAKQEFH